MTKNLNIQILVVQHKPAYVPNDSLLKPIQVGAAAAKHKLPGMAYYDDNGKNISALNHSYGEMTALYWAWKNLNADYYGLFHYRRYLSFADEHFPVYDKFNFTSFSSIEEFYPQIGIDEKIMRGVIEKYDLIVPEKGMLEDEATIYDHYAKMHNIRDLDYCLDYIAKKYPEISAIAQKAVHQKQAYFCNMFIMKKQIFQDYCRFVFDVLEHFNENIDYSQYNVYQHRVVGFLAERLTNIYIQYLFSLNRYKIKELQGVLFESSDSKQQIKPIASKDNVAIALAANDYYAPFISQMIHSIANYSSKQNTYDIIVFNKDISVINQKRLADEFTLLNNVHVRFYDISGYLSKYSRLFTRGHFTIETYFRLFIQDVMVDYDKVLYLDSDMTVLADVSELYNTNVEGYLLAATRDPDSAGLYNGAHPSADFYNYGTDLRKKNYVDSVLKLKNPYDYFQAGVLLLNLDEMRRLIDSEEVLKLAMSRNWELLDQDILNVVAEGHIKFIDMAWNVMFNWKYLRLDNVIAQAPVEIYNEYIIARSHPRIIHYAAPDKPWHIPDCDFAEYFWYTARQSVFYETILARVSQYQVACAINSHPNFLRRMHSTTVRLLRKSVEMIAPINSPQRKPIAKLHRALKSKS